MVVLSHMVSMCSNEQPFVSGTIVAIKRGGQNAHDAVDPISLEAAVDANWRTGKCIVMSALKNAPQFTASVELQTTAREHGAGPAPIRWKEFRSPSLSGRPGCPQRMHWRGS